MRAQEGRDRSLTCEQEPTLVLPRLRSAGAGDRDLAADRLAGVGERRRSQPQPDPGPGHRHGGGDDRGLASGSRHGPGPRGAGEDPCRRRSRPQPPRGGSEEAGRAGQGSHGRRSVGSSRCRAARRTVAVDRDEAAMRSVRSRGDGEKTKGRRGGWEAAVACEGTRRGCGGAAGCYGHQKQRACVDCGVRGIGGNHGVQVRV